MFSIKNYYRFFIGCEIHLKCKINKIFSNKSLNIYDIAYPGVLPNFNNKIINFIFLINFLFYGNFYFLSILERKLYFYYDIPKNYQITQNNFQNTFNLFIKNKCNKKIIIKKIHFEEDAASSKDNDIKKINYKRSGNSLFEFVTEPSFNNYKCLIYFIKKIKKKIFNNKISKLNMHLNEMRIDLNISTMNLFNLKNNKKIEIKNLNSFENIKNSIKYEFFRQILIFEKNNFFFSQTRSFNEKNTLKIRKKCFSKNYNYNIDYDFGYYINFDYNIFFNKKKIFFLEKYPKIKYFLLKKKKNKFFIKNKYFLKKKKINLIFLKKIYKYKKIFFLKKNIKFKFDYFFDINF